MALQWLRMDPSRFIKGDQIHPAVTSDFPATSAGWSYHLSKCVDPGSNINVVVNSFHPVLWPTDLNLKCRAPNPPFTVEDTGGPLHDGIPFQGSIAGDADSERE